MYVGTTKANTGFVRLYTRNWKWQLASCLLVWLGFQSIAAVFFRLAGTLLFFALYRDSMSAPVSVAKGLFVFDTSPVAKSNIAALMLAMWLLAGAYVLSQCAVAVSREALLWFSVAVLCLDLSFDVSLCKDMSLYYHISFTGPPFMCVVPLIITSSAAACLLTSPVIFLWPCTLFGGCLVLLLHKVFVDPRQPLPANPNNIYPSDSLTWSWLVLTIHVCFLGSLLHALCEV